MPAKFTIEISDGGDAFKAEPATEIGRILRELADKFENDGGPEDLEYFELKLLDHDGEVCGSISAEFSDD